MSRETPQQKPPSPGGGVFGELTRHGKLIVRLILDSRVNLLLKFLPIGAFLYMVIPDIVIGPLDDAFILWLGTTLFIELCPRGVVQEHRDNLTDVIDGEWHEVVDDDESGPPQSSLPSP